MAKYYNGIYTPKNMDKFIGNKLPVFRSSWEKTVFNLCDTNPSVIKWGSECVQIKYVDPTTNKVRTYFPDMLITYIDSKGVKHTELVEIKPLNQTVTEMAKSKQNKKEVLINHAKWEAAMAWCKMNSIQFRVLTENQIFGKSKKKRKK